MICPFCKKDTAEARCMDTVSFLSGRTIKRGYRVVCGNRGCGTQGPKRSSNKLAAAAWKRAIPKQ
jgi:hypothetical protein